MWVVQAVAGMHAKGWGHCDFKPEQVRVTLSQDGFASCKVVDVGSSTSFKGEPNTLIINVFLAVSDKVCITLCH